MPKLSPARLTALNFGIQLIWGAILAVALQARTVALVGGDGVRAYALIASLGASLAVIVQIAAGRAADARRAAVGHRREFYALGVAGAVPALFWFFLAPTFAQLMAAFFLLQIALNVLQGPYQAAIPDYAPPQRAGEASSWMSALQSLGNAAGLVIAGFVQDFRVIAAALAAPLAATYLVTARHVRGLRAVDAPPARLRLSGALGVLLVSRGLVNVGFFTLVGFLLFFVRDSLGVTDPAALRMQTALLFLSFTVAGVAGAALFARPADRYDKRLVVTVANAIILVALAFLAIASSLTSAYVAAIAAGAAWGGFVTADWALACVVLPRGAMATAMGVWNIATAGPQIVAPLLTAPLVLRVSAAHAGSGPRAAIALAIVEFAAGTAYLWRLRIGT